MTPRLQEHFPRPNQLPRFVRWGGFTLVETLVALLLVSAILLPASFWLYRSKTSQASWDHFRAAQLLEMKMNRAFLTRLDKDWSEEIPDPGYLRFEIHVVTDGGEARLLGTARNRKGATLAHLETAYFKGKLP